MEELRELTQNEYQEVLEAFNAGKLESVDGADFYRQVWDEVDKPSLWREKLIYNGKHYLVTYKFYKEDIVDKDGFEKSAEDFPWDDDHIVDIEAIVED